MRMRSGMKGGGEPLKEEMGKKIQEIDKRKINRMARNEKDDKRLCIK